MQVMVNVVKHGGTVTAKTTCAGCRRGLARRSGTKKAGERLCPANRQAGRGDEGDWKAGARQGGVNPGRIPRPRTYDID